MKLIAILLLFVSVAHAQSDLQSTGPVVAVLLLLGGFLFFLMTAWYALHRYMYKFNEYGEEKDWIAYASVLAVIDFLLFPIGSLGEFALFVLYWNRKIRNQSISKIRLRVYRALKVIVLLTVFKLLLVTGALALILAILLE